MSHLPRREIIDQLVDERHVLVVFKDQSPKLRQKIREAAEVAGLEVEGGHDVDELEHHAAHRVEPAESRPSVATVRIRQDITVTVDAAELQAAGGVLFKQEIFVGEKDLAGGGASGPHAPHVVQSHRSLWLVGRKARAALEKLLGPNDPESGFLLTDVYVLPGLEHDPTVRYAIDPWFANLRIKPEALRGDRDKPRTLQGAAEDVPIDFKGIREYFDLDPKVERVVGEWFIAPLAKPGGDLYDFARTVEEKFGSVVDLAGRSLPMTSKLAGIDAPPPSDTAYVPQQRAKLLQIRAEEMWGKVKDITTAKAAAAAAGANPQIIVYLIDIGVFVPGAGVAPIDVVMDPALSVLINLTPGGPYTPGSTPIGGDTHGTKMAGIVGAVWGDGGIMGGLTGSPALGIKQVSLRCDSLSSMSDALEYAALKTFQAGVGTKGVVVFGLDVLYYYSLSKCAALTAETNRFETVLANVTSLPAGGPTSTKADLLVVMPAGNQDFDDPNSPASVPAVPPATSMAGTLIVAACNAAANGRLNNSAPGVRMASRTASGTDLSLSAPGEGIFTSFNTLAGAPPPAYGSVYGTSFAAAHVGGVAALARFAKPALSAAALKTALLSSIIVPNPLTGGPTAVGAGLLDGLKAVS